MAFQRAGRVGGDLLTVLPVHPFQLGSEPFLALQRPPVFPDVFRVHTTEPVVPERLERRYARNARRTDDPVAEQGSDGQGVRATPEMP